MKKGLTLALMLILSSIFVFGQLEKGNIFIQGSSSFGFTTEKFSNVAGGTATEASKSTCFKLTPKAGYFIIENLPVGLSMDLDFCKTKETSSGNEYTDNAVTIGPFARYYLLPQEKLKPAIEAFAGIGNSKSRAKYPSYTSEYKYGVFKVGFGAGASYFITNNAALDFLVGYYSSTYKLKSQSNSGAIKSVASEDQGEKYTGVFLDFGVVITIPHN